VEVVNDSLETLGGAVLAAEGPVTVLADTVGEIVADPRRRRLWGFIIIIGGLVAVGLYVSMKRRRAAESGESSIR
jgi:hypothetical protein